MGTTRNKRNPWAWIPTLYFAEGLPNVIVTALSVVMYMQMGLTDAEAEEPGAHRVLGVLGLLRSGACRPLGLCHLAECEAKLNVAFQLSCVKTVLLAA